MSFNIELYTTLSERTRIRKTLTPVGTITGTLKDASSVVNPVVIIEGNAGSLAHVNYMRIPEFNRYYFIEDITSIRNNIVAVTCRCDVLMTYADEILNNSAIVCRQENDWNLYLNDGSFRVLNKTMIYTKDFPSGFENPSYVLTIAGGDVEQSSGGNSNE